MFILENKLLSACNEFLGDRRYKGWPLSCQRFRLVLARNLFVLLGQDIYVSVLVSELIELQKQDAVTDLIAKHNSKVKNLMSAAFLDALLLTPKSSK